MQITKAEVIPIELKTQHPARIANLPEIRAVTAIFVRIETRQGQSAWGCTVAHPGLTGEKPEEIIRSCQDCANLVPDMHPLNIEWSLDTLAMRTKAPASVLCAFDLAFHSLLSMAAGIPLYRLLGGYRNRIQTSVTLPIASIDESIEMARSRASQGFRILKIKGGINPVEDIERVLAIYRILPHHILRLDADGGYTVPQALDVARALANKIEMLEQPTPADDLQSLAQVEKLSPVLILADQSVKEPASAFELAANRIAGGLSIKLVACGGLRNGRQIDAIARAARMATMVSCYIEPMLLINAGLILALSSPNVRYGDLDGYFDLVDDPSRAGFRLEDGWLIANENVGLGYTVELGF